MFLFLSLARCWSEEALVIGMEIMFRSIGDTGPQTVQKVLDIGDETLERPSLAGAFLAYVERAPYNTDCFNHWRYTQNAYANGITDYTSHSNQDDLTSTLSNTLNGIKQQTINGAWPYHFAFKTMLATFLEAYAPLHNIEMFSNDFKDGDNSGRNFNIKYNGQTMSLHDFWDSGCGRYTKQVPFSAADWKQIDNEVTWIFANYTKTSFGDNLQDDPILAQVESYNLSVEQVYQGVQVNQELSSDYVAKCKALTDKRIAEAAYALGSTIKSITVPVIQKNPPKVPMRTSEAIAWTITCLLLPLTIYLVWNFFQNKSKSD